MRQITKLEFERLQRMHERLTALMLTIAERRKISHMVDFVMAGKEDDVLKELDAAWAHLYNAMAYKDKEE